MDRADIGCLAFFVALLVAVVTAIAITTISNEHGRNHFQPGCKEVSTGRVNGQFTSKLECPPPWDKAGASDE